MYQGKFDSKNKKTAVDVSQLVAQRNSAPSQEQPQRQPVRENLPRTNPARTQQSTRQQNIRQSQPTGSPAESGRP